MSDKRDTSIEVADPFARQLMARYLERRQTDLQTLDRALADADFEALRLAGHNLSGSGSAYGLDEVSRLGRCIEQAADSKDTGAIRRHLDELAEFVRKIRLR